VVILRVNMIWEAQSIVSGPTNYATKGHNKQAAAYDLFYKAATC